MSKLKAVTIKLPVATSAKVARIAKAKKTSRSAVIREAIDRLDESSAPFLSVAGDSVGSIDGPADLSTNPAYLDGYGDD